jgi:hypothetical protein
MGHTAELQGCIEQCLDCHRICEETITYCLGQGGDHVATDHIRLLMDCAEICQTSANFMLRDSQDHSAVCGVCAEVCRRCADDCARFEGDEQMQRCAEVCRRCATSCEQMAGART